jgi:L-alanine-DL-glutamate epimerase-like enolase superfamily enzyme
MRYVLTVTVRAESWPIRGVFRIARGARTEARVVIVEMADGDARGRGECVPYPHYGETVEGVVAAIEGLIPALRDGADRDALQELLPAGAARNAVDCALWDLAAKRAGRRVWDVAEMAAPGPVTTAYTISLDAPEVMGAAARDAAHRPLLKLKLTGDGDLERIAAVRAAAPTSRIIVDANEAWTPSMFHDAVPRLLDLRVDMIEQPFPASNDEVLRELDRPIPVTADEACHTRSDLDRLVGCYDLVNIKLDKTGGLTEARALMDAARLRGFGIMVGCMIGTSLGVAPAMVLAPGAAYVDLDAPLLLARDRPEGLRSEGSTLFPPEATLWG